MLYLHGVNIPTFAVTDLQRETTGTLLLEKLGHGYILRQFAFKLFKLQ